MLRDLDQLEAPELPDYDICIVGSGPAGMTTAAELVGSGLRVVVLESGRAAVTQQADALRRVESEGIQIKDYSRERVLGGTSTTWAGLAAELDEIDFAPRPWLDHSGWPIPRSALQPYWRAAAQRYRFPSERMFSTSGFGALRQENDFHPTWEKLEEKVFLATLEAQNFGREWRHIFEDEDTDAWLDATVVELECGETPRKVIAARVKSSAGRELRLRARVFVIAGGGIENARLLLNSCVTDGGLGNQHDQVGRYLMNHPKNYHGLLHLAQPTGDLPYYFGCMYLGFAGYAGLRLKEDYQREQRLLNSYVRLEPLFPWTDSEGVEALVYLAKQSGFLMRRWKNKRSDEVVALRDYAETGDDSDLQNSRKTFVEWLRLLCKIPLDGPKVLHYLRYRLITRAKPRIRQVRLRNFMEMEPCAENRVLMTEDLDALGARKPRVIHDSTEKDRQSVVKLHECLKREFSEQGFGELETNLLEMSPWPIDQEASHHLGTTRMGDDPTRSVVDCNLRLHGATNIYMAGGSVFPTSGCANPTFTICALSIRLAEHLRREFSSATGEFS